MDPYSPLLFFFILSWLFSLWSNQMVWRFAQLKQVFDQPNARSSHSLPIPRIGGVVFFVVFSITFFFSGPDLDWKFASTRFIAAMLLFAVGLYDDLYGVRPLHKLLTQIGALFVLFIPYYHAILQFGQASLFAFLPGWLFLFLVFLFFLTLLNAINLIDGINGLAALLSIHFFVVMGLLFKSQHSSYYAILSWILVGSLIAFLFFNLSRCRKMFMGDCGSLLLGFFMSDFALQLIKELSKNPLEIGLSHGQLSAIMVALFFLPIFDLLRVFINRIRKGQAVFHPDRSHIHHLLIDRFGKSHLEAALLLTAFQVVLILIVYATLT